MNQQQTILVLSNVPILAVVVYALVYYHRFSPPIRLFIWFGFISGIIQFVSVALWFNTTNNMFLLHIYVPVGTVVLIYFYRSILGAYLPKWVFPLLASVFVVFSLTNSVLLQPLSTFNSNALTVQAVLLVILSLSTYSQLLQSVIHQERQASLTGLNWINSGVFVYFSSNILLYYFGNWLTTSTTIEEFQYSWLLHAFFTTVFYVCILIGLWKSPKH